MKGIVDAQTGGHLVYT